MPKADICVVIPAYNEERVIHQSLTSLKRIIRKKHIYVVSDGSTDQTAILAKRQNVNTMVLRKNWGKAKAINKLITTRNLTNRYKYVLFNDADSQLSKNFLKEVKQYVRHKPACIVATVVSDHYGLVSAFRTYEYGLTHKIFKKAQGVMSVITVAPGCASLYRGDILPKLDFSKHTLTEDFDLTIQIHQKRLGKIIYVPRAQVVTQDPPTLRDYWKQITRWYTGFWQNIFMHKLYKPTRLLNFELYILVLDSFAWMASFIFALIYPETFIHLVVITYLSLICLSLIIISLEKQFWAILYMPLFPILYFLNLCAYTYSFFRALIFGRRTLGWNKVARYSQITS